jgi:signal transduction histidine kinase
LGVVDKIITMKKNIPIFPTESDELGKIVARQKITESVVPMQLSNKSHNFIQVLNRVECGRGAKTPELLLKPMILNIESLSFLEVSSMKSHQCLPDSVTIGNLARDCFGFYASEQPNNETNLDLSESVGNTATFAVKNPQIYLPKTHIQEKSPQAIMILSEQEHGSESEEATFPRLPQQMGVIQRLTNLFNQRLSHLPELLDLVVKEVCSASDRHHFCLLALYNPQNQQLEIAAADGIVGEQVNCFKNNGSSQNELGLLNRVFVSGVSQLFRSSREWEDGRVGEWEHGKASIAFSPSSVSHRLPSYLPPASMYAVAIESESAGRIGVLAIGNWENSHAFNLVSQDFFDSLGEVAAIAINNAKMIQQSQEREQCLIEQNEILKTQNCKLEKTQHQFQLQNLELLEAAQLKSQFLATTSHELRTPLNVILGLSQVLLRQRNSTLSEQQTDMVQRILNNGSHLLGMIDDMLYFAKAEAGRLSFQPQDFNLNHLILNTIDEHRSLAEGKNLDLQVELNLHQALVFNDSLRLKQVLVKLLLNAIKFTEAGRVRIKVWETSPEKIAIAIQDTGIGIAESDLGHIFELFRQVDQTITRKYGGTGLGLAVTKSLVEIMQGTITVTSQVGGGSTFCIELPRQVKCDGCGWGVGNKNVPSDRIIF